MAELKLKSCQIELLEKLSKFGKPIVSLVVAGRAYVLTEIAEYSNALVWCGYSGIEGARAIYDTLYGVKNSFGRLSFSLPKSVGQLPIYYNSKRSAPYVDMDDKPLYAFGYGLSYSDFSYGNFTLKTIGLDGLKNGEKITLSFDVTNHSDRAGMEIPQLYVYKSGGTITHRLKELKGFEKVSLGAGETKRICFALGFDELKEWSVRRKYELLPCALTVMLGRASDDIVWQTKVEIK